MHSALVGPDDQRGGGDDRADTDELEQVGSPCLYQFLDPGLVGFSLGAQVTDRVSPITWCRSAAVVSGSEM